ncbi:hypothetical protein Y032_0311g2126 [Ancylostoma ceylanicum]|uniref:Uncharacterized protein n=1 Tax=Ancylostoma ceylanicum TaxID=53326 RepID=A0A016S231_9BILA|nr:hypothetical protein Y032_0311g2126 [Ancylostoma ceylanicum]
MNGDVENEIIRSQGGIRQRSPSVKYHNPVGVHLKKIDYRGNCECRVEAWSEQFHNTVSVTVMLIVLGTFALMYFWAGRIFERKKALGQLSSRASRN